MTYTSCLEVPWKTALQVTHWMVIAACNSLLVAIAFKTVILPLPASFLSASMSTPPIIIVARQVYLQVERLTALDFNWDWSPFPAAALVFLSLLA